MDNYPDDLSEKNENQSESQEQTALERKPLYVYQRIRKEGPGYSHRDKGNKPKKKKEHSNYTTFSLPRIEKDQYGKFTLSAVAVLLMTIILIALGRISSNLLYMFSEKFLYFFRLDSLPFDKFSFDNLQVLTTYILSFIFGGIIVYLLLKILSVFSANGIIFQSGHALRLILTFFVFIFAIITVIKFLSGCSFYSIKMMSTMAPLCVYLCSTLISIFSKTDFLNN